MCTDLLRSRAWGARTVDGLERFDGTSLDAWISDNLGTALHTCATVPFGTNGPVGGDGRARALDGLWVGDLSILPDVPHRGPAVAAMLVGDTVATAMGAPDSF